MLPVIPKGCGLHEYFEILIRFSDIQQLKDTNIQHYINKTIQILPEKANNKKQIFGVEAGMLIVRSGTFFEKNTFRLGIGTNYSKIFVKAFVYFPGGINDVYPGISFFGKF